MFACACATQSIALHFLTYLSSVNQLSHCVCFLYILPLAHSVFVTFTGLSWDRSDLCFYNMYYIQGYTDRYNIDSLIPKKNMKPIASFSCLMRLLSAVKKLVMVFLSLLAIAEKFF